MDTPRIDLYRIAKSITWVMRGSSCLFVVSQIHIEKPPAELNDLDLAWGCFVMFPLLIASALCFARSIFIWSSDVDFVR